MRTTFVMARLTFNEAVRRKILLCAFLMGLLFLAIYSIGFLHISREAQQEHVPAIALHQMRNFLVTAGLYVVNFLTVMMTVLVSVDTLAGEISSGTIHAIASKPIRRGEIVAGKWLGFVIMLTLYLLLMAGGVLASVYLISGYSPPNPARCLTFIWLNGMLMLSVSLLGGAIFTTLTNGVLVFGLFGISFVGGWIEHIGSFLQRQAAVNVGVVCSLIFPSEALWRRAAFEIQSPLIQALGFSPFAAPSAPNLVMVGYAVLYSAVALLLAVRAFSRRDL